MRMPFRASTVARALIVVLFGALSLLLVSAPYWAAHSHPRMAAFAYLIFSPVCHQSPERSFACDGYSWAACHRCSGIYFGIFLMSLLPMAISLLPRLPRARRIWVFTGSSPLLLDALLPAAGIWTNGPASRFASGFLFGVMISTLLLPGITEFLEETARQGTRAPDWILDGGTLWTRKEC
jgi:uncharacterized membrane protein